MNDVLSLCVGLWAVKVANKETTSNVYTFGVCIVVYLLVYYPLLMVCNNSGNVPKL